MTGNSRKGSLKNFRLWPGKIGRFIFIIVILLMAAEITARFLHTPPPARRVYDPFSHKIPRPNLVERFKITNDADEWVTVQMNELGMRGPSTRDAVEDGLVLVFLGGSTTENYRFNEKDTFPYLTGRHLGKALKTPVSVFNAGMSGATTGHSLSRLQHQVLDLHPDMILVCHAVNDLISGFHPAFRMDGRHLKMTPAVSKPASYLLSWLRAGGTGGDYTSDAPYGLMATPERPDREKSVADFTDFPGLAAFRRNIRSMAAIAASHSVPLLFLTQGSMYGAPVPEPEKHRRLVMTQNLIDLRVIPPDFKSLALGMDTFNRLIMDLETGPFVHTFDAASRIPGAWSFFYDDCHLTKKGNVLLAEIISPVIESILTE